jgi:predicted nucleic acid-binding protein
VILADTSAWVEYDRATGSSVDHRMAELIADGGRLAVTEPVMMEVLAGASDEAKEQNLRRLLRSVGWLPFDALTDFDAATRIYRRCRQSGVTPRAMIAAVAWRHDAALLCCDIDLNRVASVIGIDLDPGSVRE